MRSSHQASRTPQSGTPSSIGSAFARSNAVVSNSNSNAGAMGIGGPGGPSSSSSTFGARKGVATPPPTPYRTAPPQPTMGTSSGASTPTPSARRKSVAPTSSLTSSHHAAAAGGPASRGTGAGADDIMARRRAEIEERLRELRAQRSDNTASSTSLSGAADGAPSSSSVGLPPPPPPPPLQERFYSEDSTDILFDTVTRGWRVVEANGGDGTDENDDANKDDGGDDDSSANTMKISIGSSVTVADKEKEVDEMEKRLVLFASALQKSANGSMIGPSGATLPPNPNAEGAMKHFARMFRVDPIRSVYVGEVGIVKKIYSHLYVEAMDLTLPCGLMIEFADGSVKFFLTSILTPQGAPPAPKAGAANNSNTSKKSGGSASASSSAATSAPTAVTATTAPEVDPIMALVEARMKALEARQKASQAATSTKAVTSAAEEDVTISLSMGVAGLSGLSSFQKKAPAPKRGGLGASGVPPPPALSLNKTPLKEGDEKKDNAVAKDNPPRSTSTGIPADADLLSAVGNVRESEESCGDVTPIPEPTSSAAMPTPNKRVPVVVIMEEEEVAEAHKEEEPSPYAPTSAVPQQNHRPRQEGSTGTTPSAAAADSAPVPMASAAGAGGPMAPLSLGSLGRDARGDPTFAAIFQAGGGTARPHYDSDAVAPLTTAGLLNTTSDGDASSDGRGPATTSMMTMTMGGANTIAVAMSPTGVVPTMVSAVPRRAGVGGGGVGGNLSRVSSVFNGNDTIASCTETVGTLNNTMTTQVMGGGPNGDGEDADSTNDATINSRRDSYSTANGGGYSNSRRRESALTTTSSHNADGAEGNRRDEDDGEEEEEEPEPSAATGVVADGGSPLRSQYHYQDATSPFAQTRVPSGSRVATAAAANGSAAVGSAAAEPLRREPTVWLRTDSAYHPLMSLNRGGSASNSRGTSPPLIGGYQVASSDQQQQQRQEEAVGGGDDVVHRSVGGSVSGGRGGGVGVGGEAEAERLRRQAAEEEALLQMMMSGGDSVSQERPIATATTAADAVRTDSVSPSLARADSVDTISGGGGGGISLKAFARRQQQLDDEAATLRMFEAMEMEEADTTTGDGEEELAKDGGGDEANEYIVDGLDDGGEEGANHAGDGDDHHHDAGVAEMNGGKDPHDHSSDDNNDAHADEDNAHSDDDANGEEDEDKANDKALTQEDSGPSSFPVPIAATAHNHHTAAAAESTRCSTADATPRTPTDRAPIPSAPMTPGRVGRIANLIHNAVASHNNALSTSQRMDSSFSAGGPPTPTGAAGGEDHHHSQQHAAGTISGHHTHPSDNALSTSSCDGADPREALVRSPVPPPPLNHQHANRSAAMRFVDSNNNADTTDAFFSQSPSVACVEELPPPPSEQQQHYSATAASTLSALFDPLSAFMQRPSAIPARGKGLIAYGTTNGRNGPIPTAAAMPYVAKHTRSAHVSSIPIVAPSGYKSRYA